VTDAKPATHVLGAHFLLAAVKCSACSAVTLNADPSVVAAVKRGERLLIRCERCNHMVTSSPMPRHQRAMGAKRVEERNRGMIQVVSK